MIGFINKSVETIRNHGFRGYAQAIKRCLLWHPVIDEFRWQLKLLSKAQSKIIRTINGDKMQVDSPFCGVNKHLYLYGCHEPEFTKIFSEILPRDAKVIDVGANIGYYVLIAARIAQKIYAIEPEPRSLELLKKNIALNSYDDLVEVHQLAISNRIGKALLSISDRPDAHRLLEPDATQYEKVIEIETTTLDEFLKDKDFDVVRMDVEGAEWLVIQGMRDILGRINKPLILIIEVHPWLITHYGGDAVKMLELLFDSGFKLSHLVLHEPTMAFPLRSYIKAQGLPQGHAFHFHPPLNSQTIDNNISHIIKNVGSYKALFLERL